VRLDGPERHPGRVGDLLVREALDDRKLQHAPLFGTQGVEGPRRLAEIRRFAYLTLSMILRLAIIATNVVSDARFGSNRSAFFQTSTKIS
jgi:hypothetical protein